MVKIIKNILLLLLTLLFISNVFADVKQDVYVTPNEYDNSLNVKVVTTFYVDDSDYYLPSDNYDEYFEPTYENIKITDFGENKIRTSLVSTDENWIIYNIKYPKVEYSEPYRIMYEYTIPNKLINYLGNYYTSFWLNYEEGFYRDVYYCKPINSDYYKSYDSTPEEYKETIDYSSITISNINPINFTSIDFDYTYKTNPYLIEGLSTFCNDGEEDYLFSDIIGYYEFYEVKYNVNSDDVLKTYKEDNLELILPETYSSKISNLMKAKNVIPLLKDEYNFEIPEIISIKVVDDFDEVFGDNEENNNSILCYEDGICFFKNSIYFVEEDDFDLANTIKTILTATSVETYGELDDNWFSNAYHNKLLLDLMDTLNYDTTEIKEYIKSNVYNDSDITDTQILLDLEENCPNLISNVNSFILEKGGISFDNDYDFNNFLLYTFSNICEETNAMKIYDENNLPYDKEVINIKNSYITLKNKIDPLSNNLSLDTINNIKSKFESIEKLFLKGKFSEASDKIIFLEEEYSTKILPLMNILNEYIKVKNELEEKENSLEVKKLNNGSIIENIYLTSKENKLKASLDGLNDGDIDRAKNELKNAQTEYEKAVKLQNLINDYVDKQNFYEEDNSFNLFSNSKDEQMDLTLTAIKEGNNDEIISGLSNAETEYEKGKTNSKILLTIIILIIIVIVFFVIYNSKNKPQNYHNIKHDKKETIYKKGVCANCGTKKTKKFWDYDYGYQLCSKCHLTVGDKWEKKHNKNE